jgi:hypothetical protein
MVLAAAVGLPCASDIKALANYPRWDTSAMDGFAVRARDKLAASPNLPVRLSLDGHGARHSSSSADGARLQIASVHNDYDMAMTAAKFIMGRGLSGGALVWSNQYDLRLQAVGLSTGHDELVIRGEPSTRSFSAIYLARGRVVILDCVNSTKDYV